jgi:hypothetical protein
MHVRRRRCRQHGGPIIGTRRMTVVAAVNRLRGRRERAGSAKTTAGHSGSRRETGPSASILVTFSNTTKRTFDLASLYRCKLAFVRKSVDILSMAFSSSSCSDCGRAFQNVGMMVRSKRSTHDRGVCDDMHAVAEGVGSIREHAKGPSAPSSTPRGLRFKVTALGCLFYFLSSLI